MNVRLELTDGLGAECVRDNFAFAGVLWPRPRVEEAPLNGDESIIEFAA